MKTQALFRFHRQALPFKNRVFDRYSDEGTSQKTLGFYPA
jgi:hypothetical protein